jgi:hypothetical protein
MIFNKEEEIMNNTINIMAQGFYGNKTTTSIDVKDMDKFILGYLDNTIPVTEKIDRTIVHVPNTDNIVIIYNKHQEEDKHSRSEKPLVIIAEMGIKIYSRCIVSKMDENGEFVSLDKDDYNKFVEYLAD